MDYSVIFNLIADVVEVAIPIGVCFALVERVVKLFFSFAFPKMYR